MKTVAVITAMESEYNAVLSLYEFDKKEGYAKAVANGFNILLIKSGIGKVNGALAAQFACANGADYVISTGLAGGIDALLSQGDVVLSAKTCYHDVWCGAPNAKGQVQDFELYFETPQEVIDAVKNSVPENYLKTGLLVTGDQFVTERESLLQIKSDFPAALSVDMESAAIAQTCLVCGKAVFLSLRIISDVVGKENQEEEYASFWQNVPQKASEMVDLILKALPK